MILDTSVVVAILLKEPASDPLVERIYEAPEVGIGAPSLVECGVVLTYRLGGGAQEMIHGFLRRFRVTELPFTERHWEAGVEAVERFGKGRHPARLNLGDCMSYAVARVEKRPLLFIGNDFPLTDISSQ